MIVTIVNVTCHINFSVELILQSQHFRAQSPHDHPHPMLHLRQGDRQQVGGLPRPPSGRVPGGGCPGCPQSQEVCHLVLSLIFILRYSCFVYINSKTLNILLHRRISGILEMFDCLPCCRYCCRRMLLGHVDLIEKLLNYAPLEK